MWIAISMGNFAWSEDKLEWLHQNLEERNEIDVNRNDLHWNLGILAQGRGQLSEVARLFRLASEQASEEKRQQ